MAAPLFYAHSENGPDGKGRREPMAEHVGSVRDRAKTFGDAFGVAVEAEAIGVLHDLGKYSKRFQDRLDHLDSGVDHASVGGEAAVALYNAKSAAKASPQVRAMQTAIRGHHLGLETPQYLLDLGQGPAQRQALERVRDETRNLCSQPEAGPNLIMQRLRDDGLSWPLKLPANDDRFAVEQDTAGMLDVRMLFSCLVDADYLETEAHFNGDNVSPKTYRRYRKDGPTLNPQAAMARVEAHIAAFAKEKASYAKPDVLKLRETLRSDCLAAAELDRGVYTLTAPTGAGKTLAMLAFALAHAKKHKLRRVVGVIPFLTIIDQTAKEYREIFGDFGNDFVLEDHSNAGALPDRGDRDRRRLLAENYDAPVVLCTSVQLLESLFAHKPRPCRKLHRLANSVLMLDEVQTLPPKLAVPTLAAVSRLVERYGCTAVFATATQPAFEMLHERVAAECASGWQPREIVREPDAMFAVASRRTRVDWRLDETTSWQQIAAEMARAKTGLCVVNLKRHACDLTQLVEDAGVRPDSLFHLSTSLCQLHRERVLNDVRHRLKVGDPCLLVSTQCIEAGVDLSFGPSADGTPRGWRALAPLEAIAQAAGRINRGGACDTAGVVTVFKPEKGEEEKSLYPPGYGELAAHCETFVHRCEHQGEDIARLIHCPKLLRAYFEQLYGVGNKAEPDGELMERIRNWDFAAVAEAYRLIDGDTVRLLVPYDRDVYRRLREQTKGGLDPKQAAAWFREAAPHSVSIYRTALRAAGWDVAPVYVGLEKIDKTEADWFVLKTPNAYDRNRLGLRAITYDLVIESLVSY